MSKDVSRSHANWTLTELLSRAGIKESAFREMRRTGAVDAPTGTTSAARYGEHHFSQIRRVLNVAKQRGLSRSAACELVAADAPRPNRSPAVQSRVRAAAALSFTGNVRRLAPEVFLVYAKQLADFEKGLVDEATKTFKRELAVKRGIERLRAVPVKSTIHKLR